MGLCHPDSWQWMAPGWLCWDVSHMPKKWAPSYTSFSLASYLGGWPLCSCGIPGYHSGCQNIGAPLSLLFEHPHIAPLWSAAPCLSLRSQLGYHLLSLCWPASLGIAGVPTHPCHCPNSTEAWLPHHFSASPTRLQAPCKQGLGLVHPWLIPVPG